MGELRGTIKSVLGKVIKLPISFKKRVAKGTVDEKLGTMTETQRYLAGKEPGESGRAGSYQGIVPGGAKQHRLMP